MSGERNAAGEPEAAEFHEAANLFPLMSEQVLSELADDIAVHGLREPIWRHSDGRIIDGRNRWLACAKAGVECRHRTFEKGDETIVPFVVSKNLHRRHLTTDQRAAIAADLANLKRGQKMADTEISVSQAKAAKLMNVSVGSIQNAAAVKRADPDLHEAVKRGALKSGKARAKIAARGNGKARKVSSAKPVGTTQRQAVAQTANSTTTIFEAIVSLRKKCDQGASDRLKKLQDTSFSSAQHLDVLDQHIAAQDEFLQELRKLRACVAAEIRDTPTDDHRDRASASYDNSPE